MIDHHCWWNSLFLLNRPKFVASLVWLVHLDGCAKHPGLRRPDAITPAPWMALELWSTSTEKINHDCLLSIHGLHQLVMSRTSVLSVSLQICTELYIFFSIGICSYHRTCLWLVIHLLQRLSTAGEAWGFHCDLKICTEERQTLWTSCLVQKWSCTKFDGFISYQKPNQLPKITCICQIHTVLWLYLGATPWTNPQIQQIPWKYQTSRCFANFPSIPWGLASRATLRWPWDGSKSNCRVIKTPWELWMFGCLFWMFYECWYYTCWYMLNNADTSWKCSSLQVPFWLSFRTTFDPSPFHEHHTRWDRTKKTLANLSQCPEMYWTTSQNLILRCLRENLGGLHQNDENLCFLQQFLYHWRFGKEADQLSCWRLSMGGKRAQKISYGKWQCGIPIVPLSLIASRWDATLGREAS